MKKKNNHLIDEKKASYDRPKMSSAICDLFSASHESQLPTMHVGHNNQMLVCLKPKTALITTTKNICLE